MLGINYFLFTIVLQYWLNWNTFAIFIGLMELIRDLKIEKVKITDIYEPTYFSDTGAFDFGSLLAFRENKRCVF